MRQQSKFLSYILRHKPEEAGITLDPEGWVSVEDVLVALSNRFGAFGLSELESLVRDNDKQRFVIRDGRIRANQGHSVNVDLGLQQATPPLILYHGTQAHNLPSIMVNGLLKGQRTHVHLSGDPDTARKVGSRRRGDLVILRIDSSKLSEPVYLSENGVWLTDHVMPDAIIARDYDA